jgi:uncharacterized protein YbgA (DUF1722 family)/uncharacterized protein YbbK (DUF523 family)
VEHAVSEVVSEKPVVYVSKCLGFDACRYNGITLPNAKVDMLKEFVEFRPVCPEVEIGLGVPRQPIRLVLVGDEKRLHQPASQRDLTAEMTSYINNLCAGIDIVDGFILKDRSPSCGIKDVKLYTEAGMPCSGSESGFFGGAILERFPDVPAETEGRLSNFKVREHFLIRMFTQTRFRILKKRCVMSELVDFHAKNKFLIQSYNESMLRKMGRVVANHDKKSVADVFDVYNRLLCSALSKAPRYTSNINVLMHALGFVSKNLLPREKAYFLDSLERYRAGRIPLSVPVGVIKAHLVRYEVTYMLDQTFFEPYPEALVEITDSGKGRAIRR